MNQWLKIKIKFKKLILFKLDSVRSGCPISRARGSCIKRSSILDRIGIILNTKVHSECGTQNSGNFNSLYYNVTRSTIGTHLLNLNQSFPGQTTIEYADITVTQANRNQTRKSDVRLNKKSISWQENLQSHSAINLCSLLSCHVLSSVTWRPISWPAACIHSGSGRHLDSTRLPRGDWEPVYQTPLALFACVICYVWDMNCPKQKEDELWRRGHPAGVVLWLT